MQLQENIFMSLTFHYIAASNTSHPLRGKSLVIVAFLYITYCVTRSGLEPDSIDLMAFLRKKQKNKLRAPYRIS